MADRHGPYRKMRYLLEFDDLVKAGFSRCKLPASRTDVVEYREGTDRPASRQLWGLTRYEPMILETGITDDSIELYEWRAQVEQGSMDEARQSVAVVLLDEEGNSGARWECRDAWPARYEPASLDARGNDVAIERLELAHEGVRRVE